MQENQEHLDLPRQSWVRAYEPIDYEPPGKWKVIALRHCDNVHARWHFLDGWNSRLADIHQERGGFICQKRIPGTITFVLLSHPAPIKADTHIRKQSHGR